MRSGVILGGTKECVTGGPLSTSNWGTRRHSGGVFGNILKFFTFVPGILILSKFFIYQLMHNRFALKRILKFTLTIWRLTATLVVVPHR